VTVRTAGGASAAGPGAGAAGTGAGRGRFAPGALRAAV